MSHKADDGRGVHRQGQHNQHGSEGYVVVADPPRPDVAAVKLQGGERGSVGRGIGYSCKDGRDVEPLFPLPTIISLVGTCLEHALPKAERSVKVQQPGHQQLAVEHQKGPIAWEGLGAEGNLQVGCQ